MLSKKLKWSAKRKDFTETLSHTGKFGCVISVVANQMALQGFCTANENQSNISTDWTSLFRFAQESRNYFLVFNQIPHHVMNPQFVCCKTKTELQLQDAAAGPTPSFCWIPSSQSSRLQRVIWCCAVIHYLITNGSSGVPLDMSHIYWK